VSTPKYTIHQLPELPLEALELGGKLEHAGTEPVLTIRPQKPTPPDQPSPAGGGPQKSQITVTKYGTQVTYPKVWCHPHNDLFEKTLQVVFQRRQEPLRENEADLEAIARHERFYKLTSHKGVKLSSPYLCAVHYGPWSAIAIETESCFVGGPIQWSLFIAVIPLELTWHGAWEDCPTYPNLQVIKGDLYKINEARPCCPGHYWCFITNTCIPLDMKCESDDQVPV